MSAATGKAVWVAARNDFQQPSGRDTDAPGEPADGPAAISNEVLDVLYALTEDHDRIAHDLNDTIVQQLFAVSLDLHGALSRIDHDIDAHRAAEKIRYAITGLDQAINNLRNAVVGLKGAVPPPGNGTTSACTALPSQPTDLQRRDHAR